MNKIKSIISIFLITSSLYSSDYDIYGYKFSLPDIPDIPFEYKQSLNIDVVSSYKKNENDKMFLFTHEIGYEISTKDHNEMIYALEFNIGVNKDIYYWDNQFKLGYEFEKFNKLDPYTNKILNHLKIYGIIGIKKSIFEDENYMGASYGAEIEYKIQDLPINISAKIMKYNMDLDNKKFEEDKVSIKVKYYF